MPTQKKPEKGKPVQKQTTVILSLATVFFLFSGYHFVNALKKGPEHIHSRDDAPKNQQQTNQQVPDVLTHEEMHALEEQLKLDPENFENLRHLGHLYLEERLPGKAVEVFRKAALLNPSALDVYVELGVALRQNGQPDQAAEVLTRISNSVPEFTDAWLQLAITYRFGLEDNQKALQAFEKFLTLDSESPIVAQVKQEIEAIKSEMKN
ncbi:tetratricopeptide repeat protein [candidate division KSB1 bacterium]|nr:tetratricopeptide repeat protein [candidate division KSB1 bacterium]